MKIFSAFLIILTSVALFLLPLTAAIYDFRTDLRTDTFSTATGVDAHSANETLLNDLYDGDIGSIDIASDDTSDTPLANSYNATSRQLNITGLADNTTRSLDVSYDIDALQGSSAISTIADRVPWVWLLMVIAFAPAALFAIFTGRT